MQQGGVQKTNVLTYYAIETERGAYIHTRRTAIARKTCISKTAHGRATSTNVHEDTCAMATARTENDAHPPTDARSTGGNENQHAETIALSSQHERRQCKLACKETALESNPAESMQHASKHVDVDANAKMHDQSIHTRDDTQCMRRQKQNHDFIQTSTKAAKPNSGHTPRQLPKQMRK